MYPSTPRGGLWTLDPNHLKVPCKGWHQSSDGPQKRRLADAGAPTDHCHLPRTEAQVHVRDQWVIRLVADRQTDEAHENVLIIVWNGADHASTSIDRESSPRILMPH